MSEDVERAVRQATEAATAEIQADVDRFGIGQVFESDPYGQLRPVR